MLNREIRRSRVHFTLVELLVVISIVTILASLFLPAIRKASDTAKSISCRNNLKQLGIVAMSYTIDFDGWCLSARSDSWQTWPELLVSWKYVHSSFLYKCPGETAFSYSVYATRINYGLNYSTFGFNPSHSYIRPQKQTKVSSFNRDSKLILMADSPPVDYASVGIGTNSSTLADIIAADGGAYPYAIKAQYPVFLRHNTKRFANVVIFDGHTESLDYKNVWIDRSQHWNPTQMYPSDKTATLKIGNF